MSISDSREIYACILHSHILFFILIRFDLHELCFLKLSLSCSVFFFACSFSSISIFLSVVLFYIRQLFQHHSQEDLFLRFSISHTSGIIFLVSRNNHRRYTDILIQFGQPLYTSLYTLIKTVCVMLSLFLFFISCRFRIIFY